MTARYLGLYDETIFTRWTLGEWRSRIKGAQLAIIDAQERAVQAAWVGGVVSLHQNPKVKIKGPEKYYNAEEARRMLETGVSSSKPKQADFTLYDKVRESAKTFDWSAHLVVKESND